MEKRIETVKCMACQYFPQVDTDAHELCVSCLKGLEDEGYQGQELWEMDGFDSHNEMMLKMYGAEKSPEHY